MVEREEIMRKALMSIIAIAAIGGLVALARATAKSDDHAQLAELENRIAAGVEARDANAVMANYIQGPDLIVFDVIPPREYDGSDAYKKDWQGVFDGCSGAPKMTISDLKVVSDGRLAVGHSIQHFSCPAKNGASMDMVLRTTDAYRKTGGKWLIFHEHYSVPVDLASAKADLNSRP
jgi:ketosteroid isomerase-like protein